jgi:hypothetical protein
MKHHNLICILAECRFFYYRADKTIFSSTMTILEEGGER